MVSRALPSQALCALAKLDCTFIRVYLIGFEGDPYGRQKLVEFIDLIYPDRRFGSIADLTGQMQLDCGNALTKLEALKAENPVLGFPFGK